MHHSCGWGHDGKFDETLINPQSLDTIPFEIVVEKLWDTNFHARVTSGNRLLHHINIVAAMHWTVAKGGRKGEAGIDAKTQFRFDNRTVRPPNIGLNVGKTPMVVKVIGSFGNRPVLRLLYPARPTLRSAGCSRRRGAPSPPRIR